MIKGITITYKSVLDKYKDIKKRNQHFEELDDQSKRMEIAWDCLNLILSKVIYASKGCYWNGRLMDISGDSKQLQATLNNEKFLSKDRCSVCARGGMMLSQIRLGNSIDSSDRNRDEGARWNLQGFEIDDFYRMENEYEHCQYYHPYPAKSEEKLANICCNVLVNGNFNPEDDGDYLIIRDKKKK